MKKVLVALFALAILSSGAVFASEYVYDYT